MQSGKTVLMKKVSNLIRVSSKNTRSIY